MTSLTLNPNNGASLNIRKECVEDRVKCVVAMSHRGEVLFSVLCEKELIELKKYVDAMLRKPRSKRGKAN